ncbi:fimbria/pilus outer membrane usher protein [Stenotrophomonas sp. AB1(2024)]|uniref:fimbria/pilus outer membrane usher protein n=1 Tax=Stenotrophomonas sp. AB1(2024) TaxID=3132215 RepID=UPI00309C0A4B
MATKESRNQRFAASNREVRHAHLAGCIMMALAGLQAGSAQAAPEPSPAPQQVEFSAAFLGSTAKTIDIARYEKGNPMLPGTHRVDLYVNDRLVSRERLNFIADGDGGSAIPCIDRARLVLMGVDVNKLEADGVSLEGECLDIAQLIPDATVNADASELRLDVSIPQVAMARNPRGYVDPSLWERGVNAFTLGYNVNASQLSGSSYDRRNAYVGFEAGLNVGGWRIRNQSNYRWLEGEGDNFQNISTYAQHDIDRLQSQLTIGDTFTSGQVFESIGVRGVSLATDDRMRPDTMNGFAPTVRGVAESNARVVIRQAGFVIYETQVAPGNFEIDDLNPTGFGGDLEVTVMEADGRERTFKVPFAAVPNLLRPGVSRYAVTAGEVRNGQFNASAPAFVEATYQRGVNNMLTAYTGVQATTNSDLHRSAVVGAGFNTSLGAISLDVTGSQTQLSNDAGKQSGYSARATYSKSIPQTNTDFALAAYRYSSEGYRSLIDAANMDDMARTSGLTPEELARTAERSRFQVTVSQNLGERAGQLYVSGSRNAYWSKLSNATSYNIGYNNRFRNVSYGVSASRSMGSDGRTDDTLYLSLSVPLGSTTASRRAPTLSLQGSHGPEGNGALGSVDGTFGDRDQYRYGVNGRVGGGANSAAVSAGWQAAYATLGASYTQDSNSQRQSAVSASGALVVHPGGVTFAPQLAETVGIIEAKGASGARLSSNKAVKIDSRGYAVTTALSPYRMNDVVLDPKGTSANVELMESRLQIAPRAGAVVPVKFKTNTGMAYLLQLSNADGEPVPFAAEVVDSQGNNVGYVGQGGQTLVRLSEEIDGPLFAQWGDGDGKCSIEWTSTESSTADQSLQAIPATCSNS